MRHPTEIKKIELQNESQNMWVFVAHELFRDWHESKSQQCFGYPQIRDVESQSL